jgi:ubiquinone/menaquinone biosynthesis C-methylase UbiE
MDTPAEAVDYDAMDHAEVNRIFVADLLAAGPDTSEILDLGTGTAQIPVELCRQELSARVLAVDVAQNMIQIAQQNVRQAGFDVRIRLEIVDAKKLPYDDGQFSAVVSNSIVHHLADPRPVLSEAWRVAADGGLLFFRDLFRPDDDPTVHRLVETYAVGANTHQRRMFEDSLRAALSIEEIRQIVAELGAVPDSVRATSDRHWTWAVRKG